MASNEEYQNVLIWRGLVCLMVGRDTAIDDPETLDYEELKAAVMALREVGEGKQ